MNGMNGTVNFGSGRLFLKDSSGNAYEVAVLKESSVEFSSSQKELRGNRKYAVAIATSAQSIKGKATSGVFAGALIAAILGGTVSAGSRRVKSDVKAAAASVTVTPPDSGTFAQDYGVEDANGKPMKRVASAPTVGQYSQAGAAYTFNAAETGNVTISYAYTVAALGQTVALTNDLQAAPPTFELHLDENYSGNWGLRLFAVVMPNISFGTKAEDFTDTSVEFEAISNASNGVGEMYIP